MNYYEIGQKIRKFRKAKNISQEELAEKVGISVTHMSHIETGNTKLSLPVLVKTALELEVQTDELLFDAEAGKPLALKEIEDELMECSSREVKIILEIVKATKEAIKKYD